MTNETASPPIPKRRFALGCITGAIGMVALQLIVFTVAFLIARPHLPEKLAENMPAPPVPSQTADYDWPLTTAQGDEVTLAPAKGKVMFITLWKPGCPSCKAHLPAIQRLHDLVNDPDAAFYPIAMKQHDEVPGTADRYGLTMPYYLSKSESPPHAFDVDQAPATFVVDRSGRIVLRHVGAAQWDDPSMVEFMQSLLVEVPGEAAE